MTVLIFLMFSHPQMKEQCQVSLRRAKLSSKISRYQHYYSDYCDNVKWLFSGMIHKIDETEPVASYLVAGWLLVRALK